MIKRTSHIISFFAVLISLSLSLTTLHIHPVAEHHCTDAANHVPHSLDIDHVLCPVCGYLFSSETGSSLDVQTYLNPVESIIIPCVEHYLALYSDAPDARSPPFSA